MNLARIPWHGPGSCAVALPEITEVLPSPDLNHWLSQGWNIIEVDGHNIRELACAYRLAAQGLTPERPT